MGRCRCDHHLQVLVGGSSSATGLPRAGVATAGAGRGLSAEAAAGVGRLQSGLARVNAVQESGTKGDSCSGQLQALEPAGSVRAVPGEDCSTAGSSSS